MCKLVKYPLQKYFHCYPSPIIKGVTAFLMSQNRGFFLTSTYKSKCGQNLTNNVLSNVTLFSSHC